MPLRGLVCSPRLGCQSPLTPCVSLLALERGNFLRPGGPQACCQGHPGSGCVVKGVVVRRALMSNSASGLTASESGVGAGVA